MGINIEEIISKKGSLFMLRRLFLIMTVFLFVISGCGVTEPVNQKIHIEEVSVIKKVDKIQEQVNSMTLEEKVGQMIIGGFDGYQLDTNVQSLINQYKLGGFILFSRNIKDTKQLVQLTNALKKANTVNKIPLFLSIDQEGGRVNRMPKSIINTPSNRMIGQSKKSAYSYELGRVLAKEVSALGFNVDFAPVLDIQSNPENSVIGDRSFGSDANLVAKLGVSMMKGIQTENVISVVKHFPGHGDTLMDSHYHLPKVHASLSRLQSFEFIPFKEAIESQADMVMVAHILLSNVDGKYPASMSKVIIEDILRNQLAFNGVVVSDDLTMGAIVNHYPIANAAIRSVRAGTDLLLIGHNQDHNVEKVFQALKKAVQDKRISEERIDQSVYRILSLKKKYHLNSTPKFALQVQELNKMIQQVIKKGTE